MHACYEYVGVITVAGHSLYPSCFHGDLEDEVYIAIDAQIFNKRYICLHVGQ